MANIFDNLGFYTGINISKCPIKECKLTEGGTDLVSTITTSGLITWQRHTTVETKNVIV